MIEIADEEVILDASSVLSKFKKKKAISIKLDQILGDYRKNNGAYQAEQDKAVWHKHLEEKFLK